MKCKKKQRLAFKRETRTVTDTHPAKELKTKLANKKTEKAAGKRRIRFSKMSTRIRVGLRIGDIILHFWELLIFGRNASLSTLRKVMSRHAVVIFFNPT